MPYIFKLLIVSVLFAIPLSSYAVLTADEIMQKVDDREDGDNSIMDMEMVLIDKNGNQRKRIMRSFSRDMENDDTQSIMFFLEPADVKNTGFLNYDYDDERDDDQWLFLPALKKTKRIASSNKANKFMGSDFTYSDMSRRKIENYKHTLLKEAEVRGNKVWVIEAVPITEKEKEETGYEKSIIFVRQDNFVVVRSISFLSKGGKMKFMDIKKLEEIDGIWTPLEMVMTTKKSKKTLHSTVLISTNVKYNTDMDQDLFSIRRLEKGL